MYNIITNVKGKTMKPSYIELEGITRDKKYKIMEAVLTGDGVSRTELAERFDISSVTVGKVISAMIDRRLLVVRKQSQGKGRNTAILRPAPKLKHLIIELGKECIRTNIYHFDKRLFFTYSSFVNDSLDYTDNLLNFCSELNTLIGLRLKQSIYTVSLITNPETPREDISRVYDIFPRLKPDAVFDIEKSAVDYFCKYHSKENIVLIKIDNSVRVNLIYKGISIDSNDARATPCPKTTGDLLQYLSDMLLTLCAVTLPDRIAISSEVMQVNKDFANTLIFELTRKARIPKERIPKIEYRQEIPYATVSALDKISEYAIRTFSGYNE